MPIPDTLARKITADFRAEKKYGGRKKFCDALLNEILLIWPLGTNFSEILIKIYTFSFRKMPLKMMSGKWQQFCLSLNVLMAQLVFRMALNPGIPVIMVFKYFSLLMRQIQGLT